MATLPATTTTTSLATRSSEPRLSDKLSELLDSGNSPVIGPNNAAALREWIAQAEAFEADLERPSEERVENLIARLATATAFRHTSTKEAREAHAVYWRVLRDLPIIDLAAAFDELVRTSKFMPKPAEIFAEAKRHTLRRAFRVSRARHLVWKHETEWTPPVEPIPAAEVSALITQAGADLAARCSGNTPQAREAGR